MPEATVYTKFKNYALVRKASTALEQRDWFAEYESLFDAVDADIGKIAPGAQVIHVAGNEDTDAENGQTLVDAVTLAMSQATASQPVVIRVGPGTYDISTYGAGFLTIDTPNVHVISDVHASNPTFRTGSPVWADMRQAGATVIGNASSNGTITVEAGDVTLEGLHLQQVGAGACLSINGSAGGTLTGISVIGCSISGELTQSEKQNTMFRGCLIQNHGTGETSGQFYDCTFYGGTPFYTGGNTTKNTAVNCDIYYTVGATTQATADTKFYGCNFYGSGLFFNSNAASTIDIEMYDCNASGISSNLLHSLGRITGVLSRTKFTMTAGIFAGAVDSVLIDGCDITSSTGEPISLTGDYAVITACDLTPADGSYCVDAASAVTSVITGNNMGGTIDGVNTGTITYDGGNVTSLGWVDTQTGPTNNFNATTDPTWSDDTTQGYSFGSWYLNKTTGVMFYCTDPTAGAAVWERIIKSDDIPETYLLTATTSGSTASTFTADLVDAFGNEVPIDNTGDGESFSFDILITGNTQNVSQNLVAVEYKGTIRCESSSSFEAVRGEITEPHKYEASGVTFTTPAISASGGKITITVSHTSSTLQDTEIKWVAKITGNRESGVFSS